MGKRFLLVTVALLFLSCSKDEDNGDNFEGDADLNGAWQLTDVTCFCFFAPETNFGDTTITFDSDRDVVIVEHAGNDTFFKEEGTHTYQGTEKMLQFTADEAYTFIVKGAILKLVYVDEPNIADDEVVFTFQKI